MVIRHSMLWDDRKFVIPDKSSQVCTLSEASKITYKSMELAQFRVIWIKFQGHFPQNPVQASIPQSGRL